MFVPFSPQGRGFFTGKLTKRDDLASTDSRSTNYPRFADGAFDKNLILVDRLKDIAGRRSVVASQLALAWVLAKGDDVVPIPGTKRRKYLEENAAAVAIKLSPAEVAEIEAAVPPDDVVGARYTEAMMKSVDK